MSADLCRITVVGPDRQVDLAVPMTLPVAAILPSLLRHTASASDPEPIVGGWVLQRLGETPMAPSETPAALHWHEGERLFLRRQEQAMPPKLVDDLAEGVAEAVGAGTGRWQPDHTRRLFSVLAVVAMGLVLWLPLSGRPEGSADLAAVLTGVAFTVGALVIAKQHGDQTMAHLLGTAGCLALGLAAAIDRSGLVTGVLELLGTQVRSAALGASGTAAFLLVVGIFWARMSRWAPFGAVLGVGLGLAVAVTLRLDAGWSREQVSGLLAALMLASLVFSPRAVMRAAGLRVPQLPRNSQELQYDIEPMPSAEVSRRTTIAHECLTALSVTAAAGIGVFGGVLISSGGFATALGITVTIATAIRAGATWAIGQRLALCAAVVWPVVLLLDRIPDGTRAGWAALAVLAIGVVAMLLAMARPPGRRMVPIWQHLAHWAETLTAIVVIPLLLQLFGAYTWALGLIG